MKDGSPEERIKITGGYPGRDGQNLKTLMGGRLVLTTKNIQNEYILTQRFSFEDFAKGHYQRPAQSFVLGFYLQHYLRWQKRLKQTFLK